MYKKDDYIIVFNKEASKIKNHKDAENNGYCLARIIKKVNKKIFAKIIDDYQEKQLNYENVLVDINNILPIDDMSLEKNIEKFTQ